jgi:thiamine transport system permease protein
VGAYRTLGSDVPLLSVSPASTIVTSVQAAVAATLIAVVVGGLAAHAITRTRARGAGGALQLLLLLPLGVSAVTIGFGFIIALDRPIDLRASWWLVPIAQATVAVPFVMRTMLPGLRSVDQRQRDAAAVLGAPPHRVWREVDLPIVRRALIAAATFAAAISLGEFGATAFVARAGAPTMPIAIQQLLEIPGATAHRSAFAIAVILVVVTASMAMIADRFADARGGY